MSYERIARPEGSLYHYTKRDHLDSILRDGRIRRMGDTECWFCTSLEDTLTLMRNTVMMEGSPTLGLRCAEALTPPLCRRLCDPQTGAALSERRLGALESGISTRRATRTSGGGAGVQPPEGRVPRRSEIPEHPEIIEVAPLLLEQSPQHSLTM